MGDAAPGVATRAVQREGQGRLLRCFVAFGNVEEAVALGAEAQRLKAALRRRVRRRAWSGQQATPARCASGLLLPFCRFPVRP